jgi:hypothetical protein
LNLPVTWYVDYISEFIPVGIGLIRKRHLNLPIVLFLGSMVLSIFTGGMSYLYASHRSNTFWLFHLHSLVSTELLLMMHDRWAVGRPRIRRGLRVTAVVFFLFWLAELIWLKRIQEPPIYSLGGASVILLAASLTTYFIVLSGKSPFRDSRFWIIAGQLVYNSGNLVPYVLMGVTLSQNRALAADIWTISSIISIGANLCYSWGMVCLGRE